MGVQTTGSIIGDSLEKIPYSEITMLLPKGMTVDKTSDYIKRALEL